jgi:hypothetical protein
MALSLLSTNFNDGKIYKHTGFTTTIEDSFVHTDNYPTGIAWDGNNIMAIGWASSYFYKFQGFSDIYLDSFPQAYSGFHLVYSHGIEWKNGNLYSTIEDWNTGYFLIIKYDGISPYWWQADLSGTLYGTGIAWDGSNLIFAAGKIYKLQGFSLTIIDSFASPGPNLKGIAWDGTNLLSADSDNAKIYKHNGFSSSILATIDAPGDSIYDIEWTSISSSSSSKSSSSSFSSLLPSVLFTADWNNGEIYKHSGFSNIILGTLEVICARGVAWDGTNIYYSNGAEIFKCLGFSTTIIDSFSSPGAECNDIGFLGTDLLSCDDTTGELYRHTGFSSIKSTISSPDGYPLGIDSDGQGNIISADNSVNKIYKHSGFSTTITDSFLTSKMYTHGVTWDGNNIIYSYMGTSSQHKIYQCLGFSSTITNSFNSPGAVPIGVYWYNNSSSSSSSSSSRSSSSSSISSSSSKGLQVLVV